MDEYDARCYAGPKLTITVNREGHRVHRLADDEPLRFRAHDCQIRRDPMVAALFGLPMATLRHITGRSK
ncbi:hypothetical protein ASC94_13255 [Massilia sp. Root418]|jgi:hypothetical protein|uniref:hypothetical protein n=1 Tax=Massilia sp. Root418 TaxID=1736532 RepID=UPI0006F69B45|nr:hypothetical protein [Massilia sp. Root418]KQW93574.1 hypothetical protein ASC94_13255 [Massilia sp. Root418]